MQVTSRKRGDRSTTIYILEKCLSYVNKKMKLFNYVCRYKSRDRNSAQKNGSISSSKCLRSLLHEYAFGEHEKSGIQHKKLRLAAVCKLLNEKYSTPKRRKFTMFSFRTKENSQRISHDSAIGQRKRACAHGTKVGKNLQS